MEIFNFSESENVRKALNVLTLASGMLIFCGVILLKVDVWAKKQNTEVLMLADQLDFENLRYHRTAVDVMNKK